MLSFLKMVAAAFVAFLLLILVLFLWIRYKLKGWFKKFIDALQGGIPPFRVNLEKIDGAPNWSDKKKVDTLHEEFLQLGFEHVGDFDVNPAGILMKAYVHPTRATCGTIYEQTSVGVFCDLVRKYADGAGYTYTTTKPTGMDEPPRKTAKFFPDESLTTVAETLWRESPSSETVHVQPAEFARFFERAYAEEMNWRMMRGGPTAEEIRRIAEISGNECTQEHIDQIQDQWRNGISQFVSERQLARFRQQSTMSREEYAELEYRLIAVHDRMTPKLILSEIDKQYFVGYELDSDDDDEDAADRAERQRLVATLARVEGWCTSETPRDAFRHLMDEQNAGDRFELLTTVGKPLEGDIYLRAEPDDEYDGDEYDEELDDFSA